VLRLRAIRLLAHPVSAPGLTVGALAVLYLTPLCIRTTTDPVQRPGTAAFPAVGTSVRLDHRRAGPGPAPAVRAVPPGHPRCCVAAHAVHSQLIYAGIVDVAVPAAERRAGATLMYYGGDIAELLFAFALVASWRPRRGTSQRRASQRRTCAGADSRCRNEQTHFVYDENAWASQQAGTPSQARFIWRCCEFKP
jgi:putative membrane protein